MPAIDTDLFQLITLGLLVLTLLILLLTLLALGRVRKAVESLRGAAAPATTDARDEGGERTPDEARERDAGATAVEPRERDQGVAAYASPGAERPAATEQPAEAQSAYAAHHDVSAAAPQATPEEEPQEQPFERDGRWWFKRGDELLVYDEGTGQWVPAPAPGGAVAASASSGPGTQTAELGGAAAQEPSGDAGGLWKCPSCGATNGSTATTCRMCFAARP